MKIVERIKLAKKLLKETNAQFGNRFGVSDDTVRAWENDRPAPYHVIEFCEMVLDNLQECPACDGTGVFNKHQESYILAFGDEGIDMLFPKGDFNIHRTTTPRMKMIAGKPERFLLPIESTE